MDFNKLMQQAQAMQKQIEATSKNLAESEFVGEASNGLVKIVMTGDYKVKSVDINKDILKPEDKEMLDDLVMLAINDATNKIFAEQKSKLGNIGGGLGIPGL